MQIPLLANVAVKRAIAARTLIVLTATAPFEMWRIGIEPIQLQQGDTIPDLSGYEGEWQFRSSTTQTIDLGISTIEVRRATNGQVSISNTPAVTLSGSPAVDVGTPTVAAITAPVSIKAGSSYLPTIDPAAIAADSNAEVIAANANRLSVTIGNPASNVQNKRIGVSGNVGADRGDILLPGASKTLAVTGALWVHNIGAAAEQVTVSEVIA